MKKIFLSLIFVSFLFTSNGQITKGNWLVGGSGSFSIIKALDETTHYMQLSPNIGYFFFDKLAAGLKPGYIYELARSTGINFTSKTTGFYFGPFARYYFLNPNKPFNILLEGNYQHGIERRKGYGNTNKYSLNTFSFAAGPVIYFNSSVGLEFLTGYAQSKYTGETFHESRLQVGIGLQIHLEKE